MDSVDHVDGWELDFDVYETHRSADNFKRIVALVDFSDFENDGYAGTNI